jgi:hypothetical protein
MGRIKGAAAPWPRPRTPTETDAADIPVETGMARLSAPVGENMPLPADMRRVTTWEIPQLIPSSS